SEMKDVFACEDSNVMNRSQAMDKKAMGYVAAIGGVGLGGFSLYRMLKCQEKARDRKEEAEKKEAEEEAASNEEAAAVAQAEAQTEVAAAQAQAEAEKQALELTKTQNDIEELKKRVDELQQN